MGNNIYAFILLYWMARRYLSDYIPVEAAIVIGTLSNAGYMMYQNMAGAPLQPFDSGLEKVVMTSLAAGVGVAVGIKLCHLSNRAVDYMLGAHRSLADYAKKQ
jgi:hypothetical protein